MKELWNLFYISINVKRGLLKLVDLKSVAWTKNILNVAPYASSGMLVSTYKQDNGVTYCVVLKTNMIKPFYYDIFNA